MLSKQK
jgi:hypothetical protein